MAAPRPGNTDRGWNDPPMFDYQGTASSTNPGSPQHTKLNKRVAYPMSSHAELPLPTGTATLLNPSEGPPRLAPVQILPPTSTTTTPTPVPVVVPTISPTTDPCGDSILTPAIFSPTAATVPGIARVVGSDIKVKDLACVLADLSLQTEEALLEYVKEGLHSAAESVNDALKGRAMEDVKKKVALMGEWWACGKISQSVKSQLGSLVEALNKQLVEEAHELHVALMINHTTEVNQWMVGVKRIIQELRAKVTGSEVNQDEGQGQPKDAADPCWTLQGESLLNPALLPAALTPKTLSLQETPKTPQKRKTLVLVRKGGADDRGTCLCT
ncbi:steroid receptor RNA activator 1-like [Littorina saxatilis]|uniref:SRA1/Sec31 domain-containing protein n=1 Tax=Littorina saxatilis TaxID=31220 RepID=A0AAN9B046_9CAEN